jgi:hypothetical protein
VSPDTCRKAPRKPRYLAVSSHITQAPISCVGLVPGLSPTLKPCLVSQQQYQSGPHLIQTARNRYAGAQCSCKSSVTIAQYCTSANIARVVCQSGLLEHAHITDECASALAPLTCGCRVLP